MELQTSRCCLRNCAREARDSCFRCSPNVGGLSWRPWRCFLSASPRANPPPPHVLAHARHLPRSRERETKRVPAVISEPECTDQAQWRNTVGRADRQCDHLEAHDLEFVGKNPRAQKTRLARFLGAACGFQENSAAVRIAPVKLADQHSADVASEAQNENRSRHANALVLPIAHRLADGNVRQELAKAARWNVTAHAHAAPRLASPPARDQL